MARSAVALVLAAVLALAGTASATVPGRNGKIAFTRAGQCTGVGYVFIPGCLVLGDGVIYTVNPDGTGTTKLIDRAPGVGLPQWAPGGATLAYGWKNNIRLADADGSNDRYVTAALGEDTYGFTWSPDGSMLAFGTNGAPTDTHTGIYVVQRDGSGARLVARDVIFPVWSPDCSWIAAWPTTGAQPRLVMFHPDGSGLRTIPTNDWAEGVDWSPDSRELVFGSPNKSGPESEIYVMPAMGGAARQIAPDGWMPSWSPDGSRIVFSTQAGDLFTVRPDGSDLRSLTLTSPTGYMDLTANWQSLDSPRADCSAWTKPAPTKARRHHRRRRHRRRR